MEFGSLDGGYAGEQNTADFVDMSQIFVAQVTFSQEQSHLTEFRVKLWQTSSVCPVIYKILGQEMDTFG